MFQGVTHDYLPRSLSSFWWKVFTGVENTVTNVWPWKTSQLSLCCIPAGHETWIFPVQKDKPQTLHLVFSSRGPMSQVQQFWFCPLEINRINYVIFTSVSLCIWSPRHMLLPKQLSLLLPEAFVWVWDAERSMYTCACVWMPSISPGELLSSLCAICATMWICPALYVQILFLFSLPCHSMIHCIAASQPKEVFSAKSCTPTVKKRILGNSINL